MAKKTRKARRTAASAKAKDRPARKSDRDILKKAANKQAIAGNKELGKARQLSITRPYKEKLVTKSEKLAWAKAKQHADATKKLREARKKR